MSKNSAIAYIPVLHRGYFSFLEEAKNRGITDLYLVGDEILSLHEELDYLNRKDRIRAIPLQIVESAVKSLGFSIHLFDTKVASELNSQSGEVLMPREDISVLIKERYLPNCPVDYSDIFLRWHRDNTAEEKAIEAHRSLSVSEFDREMMGRAIEESKESFDWWRQIGAVIAKDGEPLLVGRNEHMPDEQSPNVFGDPRSLAKRGTAINITTSAHAEVVLIGEAARRGMSLTGASLYVTDFPCPYCARLIAHSGITKCYFSRGYAVLDGGEFLKEQGVELIFVDMKKDGVV